MIKKIIKNNKFNIANIHIKTTLNNTICTITTLSGDTIFWISTRLAGFKGTRKSTPFAAQQTINMVSTKLQDYGIKNINILIKGLGQTREIAIKLLKDLGYNILKIKDITSIAFNGCRPPKKRRL